MTRLFNGVPAVLIDGQWVVMSADLSEIVTIPESEIDNPEIFRELDESGFFNHPTKPIGVFQLTLITTSNCNLRCRYCFANSGESVAVMSEKVAYAAVDYAIKISKGRRLSVAFFGGEPSMTDKLIKKVVSYAKKQKLTDRSNPSVEFSITTNGVMSSSFLNFLINNNFKITLSADGASEIQNFQRPLKGGGPSSHLVEKTIRKLVSSGKEFKLRVTVTDFSVTHMSSVVEWLHELGGNLVHFEPVSIAGRASENSNDTYLKKPAAEVFIDNLQKAILRGNDLGIGVVNSSFMNISTPPPEFCEGNVNNRISVSYTGDVTTCVEVQEKCHPASGNFIIGAYDDETGVIKLFQQQRIQPCSGTKMKSCSECFAVRICGGGCPVRNYHITGSISDVDPYRCENIKKMLPFLMELFLKASIEAA